jgi:hypothetical protein
MEHEETRNAERILSEGDPSDDLEGYERVILKRMLGN